MQEYLGEMFAKMGPMMDGVKKKAYDEWMVEFRGTHEGLLKQMTESVEKAQEKEAEAGKAAAMLADAVETRFAKRGKISPRRQVDINCFMIYYVFPAILLTESECAVLLADAIRNEWRARFKGSSQLEYADYNTIRGSFNDKIFGMF